MALALDEFIRLWGQAPPHVRGLAARLLRDGQWPDALPQKPRRLLSARAAGARCDMCAKSILRLHKLGRLKGVYLTGSRKSLRFNESDIEALMNVGNTEA